MLPPAADLPKLRHWWGCDLVLEWSPISSDCGKHYDWWWMIMYYECCLSITVTTSHHYEPSLRLAMWFIQCPPWEVLSSKSNLSSSRNVGSWVPASHVGSFSAITGRLSIGPNGWGYLLLYQQPKFLALYNSSSAFIINHVVDCRLRARKVTLFRSRRWQVRGSLH